MNISYAILAHDEHVELNRLLKIISQYMQNDDEIVIVTDNATQKVKDVIQSYTTSSLIWKERELNKDFASQKNYLFSLCSKDFIFNLDADEYPHTNLIQNIHTLIELNPNIEIFILPRINTVEGITESHINKWNWHVGSNNWINFPDAQSRIIKNIPTIRWKNKVHEILNGHETFITLPAEEQWAIYHPKTIDKQEKQNTFYGTI